MKMKKLISFLCAAALTVSSFAGLAVTASAATGTVAITPTAGSKVVTVKQDGTTVTQGVLLHAVYANGALTSVESQNIPATASADANVTYTKADYAAYVDSTKTGSKFLAWNSLSGMEPITVNIVEPPAPKTAVNTVAELAVTATNNSKAPATLTAAVTAKTGAEFTGTAADFTFEWKKGNDTVANANGATLDVTEAGTYTVTATYNGTGDYEGSLGPVSITIQAADDNRTSLNNATVTVTPAGTVYTNTALTAAVTIPGATESDAATTVPAADLDYAWSKKGDSDAWTPVADATAATFTPTEVGTYKVTVTAKEASENYVGTKDSAEITVIVPADYVTAANGKIKAISVAAGANADKTYKQLKLDGVYAENDLKFAKLDTEVTVLAVDVTDYKTVAATNKITLKFTTNAGGTYNDKIGSVKLSAPTDFAGLTYTGFAALTQSGAVTPTDWSSKTEEVEFKREIQDDIAALEEGDNILYYAINVGNGRQQSLKVDGFAITSETFHTVTVADGITGGTVTADKTSKLVAGDKVIITVAETDGYEYTADSLSVKDASNNAVTATAVEGQAGKYEFVMPDSNVTVTAAFAQIQLDPSVVTLNYKNGSDIVKTETVNGYISRALDLTDKLVDFNIDNEGGATFKRYTINEGAQTSITPSAATATVDIAVSTNGKDYYYFENFESASTAGYEGGTKNSSLAATNKTGDNTYFALANNGQSGGRDAYLTLKGAKAISDDYVIEMDLALKTADGGDSTVYLAGSGTASNASLLTLTGAKSASVWTLANATGTPEYAFKGITMATYGRFTDTPDNYKVSDFTHVKITVDYDSTTATVVLDNDATKTYTLTVPKNTVLSQVFGNFARYSSGAAIDNIEIYKGSAAPATQATTATIAAVGANTDLYDKKLADLTDNFAITGTDKAYKATGTLKYVTGYTGFSSDVAEQSGNYLPFVVNVDGYNENSTIKIKGSANSEYTEYTYADCDDGVFVFILGGQSTSLSIKVDRDGSGTDYEETEYTLSWTKATTAGEADKLYFTPAPTPAASATVSAATIHDTRNESTDEAVKAAAIADNDLATGYAVTENNGAVTITATNLKQHQNGDTPTSMGYWVGVKFTFENVTAGAKVYYKALAEAPANAAALKATADVGEGALDADDIANGWSIYSNASRYLTGGDREGWKLYAAFDGIDTLYAIDFSNITLYTKTAVTATVTVAADAEAYNTVKATVSDVTPAAAADALTYSWQKSTDGGETWTTIEDATTASIAKAEAPAQYKATVAIPSDNATYTGTATSDAFTYDLGNFWKAAEADKAALAGNYIMNGATFLSDIVAANCQTNLSEYTIDGETFTGYITNSTNGKWQKDSNNVYVATGMGVKFVAPENGTFTVYIQNLGSNADHTGDKTIYITKENTQDYQTDVNGVAAHYTNTSGAAGNYSTSLNVTKGETYYAYVAGSKGRFAGIKFSKDAYKVTAVNPNDGAETPTDTATITLTDGVTNGLAAKDGKVTLTAVPAAGKAVTAVTVTKASGGTVEVATETADNTYSFTMPAEPVTVTATVASTSAGAPASITVSGAASVDANSTSTYTAAVYDASSNVTSQNGVTWAVYTDAGATTPADKSEISDEGVLSVGADETAETLYIVATSSVSGSEDVKSTAKAVTVNSVYVKQLVSFSRVTDEGTAVTSGYVVAAEDEAPNTGFFTTAVTTIPAAQTGAAKLAAAIADGKAELYLNPNKTYKLTLKTAEDGDVIATNIAYAPTEAAETTAVNKAVAAAAVPDSDALTAAGVTSITPANAIVGDTVEITVPADENAIITSVKVNDTIDATKSESKENTYTVTMPAGGITSVTVNKTPIYAVTIVKPETATIKNGEDAFVSGTKVADKTALTLTGEAPTGYTRTVKVTKTGDDNPETNDVTDVVYKDGTFTTQAYAITITITDTINKYAVTFNVDGGSAVDAQDVEHGGKVTQPATDPTKDNKVFGGWYTDNTFATAFDFENTTITEATTIYAKWNDPAPTTKWTERTGSADAATYSITAAKEGDDVVTTITANSGNNVAFKYNLGNELSENWHSSTSGKELVVSYDLYVDGTTFDIDGNDWYLDLLTTDAAIKDWHGADDSCLVRMAGYNKSYLRFVGGKAGNLDSDYIYQTANLADKTWVTITERVDLTGLNLFAVSYSGETDSPLHTKPIKKGVDALTTDNLYLALGLNSKSGTNSIIKIKNVSAEVVDAPTYAITSGTVTGGTLTINPETAKMGDTVTVTPSTGVFESITADGVVNLTNNSDNATFVMPAKAVAVNAAITNDKVVTVVNTKKKGNDAYYEGGIISTASTTYAPNAAVTVTGTPYLGYKLDTVTVNDGETDTPATVNGNTATFNMPDSNVTISATWTDEDENTKVLPFTTSTVTKKTTLGGDNGQKIGFRVDGELYLMNYVWSGTEVTFTGVDYTNLKKVSVVSTRNPASTAVTASFTKGSETTPFAAPVTTNGVAKELGTPNVTVWAASDDVTGTLTGTDTMTVALTSATENDSSHLNNYWYIVLEYEEPSAPTTYTITLPENPTGGSVAVTTPDDYNATTGVAAGKNVVITATPAAGYQVKTLTVKNGDETVTDTDSDNTTYTFQMPAGNVTVEAVFEEKMVYTGTLVHTNDASWGVDNEDLTKKWADGNKANKLDAAAQFVNNESGNWSGGTYIQFSYDSTIDMTLVDNAILSIYTTNSGKNRVEKVYYLNSDEVDLTTVSNSAAPSGTTWIGNISLTDTPTTMKNYTLDITNAVKAKASSGVITLWISGHAGGATIAGKGAEDQGQIPALTINKGRTVTFTSTETDKDFTVTVNKGGAAYKTVTVTGGTGSTVLAPGEYTYDVAKTNGYQASTGNALTVGATAVTEALTHTPNVPTTVTVTAPESTTVTTSGGTLTYTAAVKDQDGDAITAPLTWSIVEETDKITVDGGVVTVAEGAAAGEYTVKAAVTADPTKYDTKTLTVVAKTPATVTVNYTNNGTTVKTETVEVTSSGPFVGEEYTLDTSYYTNITFDKFAAADDESNSTTNSYRNYYIANDVDATNFKITATAATSDDNHIDVPLTYDGKDYFYQENFEGDDTGYSTGTSDSNNVTFSVVELSGNKLMAISGGNSNSQRRAFIKFGSQPEIASNVPYTYEMKFTLDSNYTSYIKDNSFFLMSDNTSNNGNLRIPGGSSVNAEMSDGFVMALKSIANSTTAKLLAGASSSSTAKSEIGSYTIWSPTITGNHTSTTQVTNANLGTMKMTVVGNVAHIVVTNPSDTTIIDQYVNIADPTYRSIKGILSFVGSRSYQLYDDIEIYAAKGADLFNTSALTSTTVTITSDDTKVGTVLTAALDVNTETAAYTWQRSTDGETWTDIATTVDNTYTLVDADLGNTIRVIATGRGLYTGTLTSTATATVVAAE